MLCNNMLAIDDLTGHFMICKDPSAKLVSRKLHELIEA